MFAPVLLDIPRLFIAVLALSASWASAQTYITPLAPPVTDSSRAIQPGTALPAQPSLENKWEAEEDSLSRQDDRGNPLNRNPARRGFVPDATPIPPDPRDSTSRPTLQSEIHDPSRETLIMSPEATVSPPGQPASAPRLP